MPRTIKHGKDADNSLAKDEHNTLNTKIDFIFVRIPASRLLLTKGRHFFHKPKAWRKSRKLRDKRKWIWNADIVLT